MKKLLAAALILSVATVQAQKKAPVKSGARTASPLKNLTDSASYAIGLSVATFYKQQGFKNLNTAVIAKAINDVQLKGGKPLMNETQANEAIMAYLNPKLQQTVAEGNSYLAANKKKANITTTASGLQYEILKQGTGARPAATDTVVVHYTGSFINGNVFESSRNSGTPVTFPLNRVVKGWTEGVQLMPQGATYKFYIPQNLGYGANDNGPIPGGSVLIFEIELLEVRQAATAPAN